MSKKWYLVLLMAAFFLVGTSVQAATVSIANKTPKAGGVLELSGAIEPGQDLNIVVSSEQLFKAADSKGSKEMKKLGDKFGDTAIPPTYYILTSAPEKLATPKVSTKGKWFPPFQWKMEVNKLKKWSDIPAEVQQVLGPVATEKQWQFVVYTHEDKFGINTVSKERPIGGGNARMVMGTDASKNWNKDVKISLDQNTGKYTVSFKLSKLIPPDTAMNVYVNGEKSADRVIVQKRGFFLQDRRYLHESPGRSDRRLFDRLHVCDRGCGRWSFHRRLSDHRDRHQRYGRCQRRQRRQTHQPVLDPVFTRSPVSGPILKKAAWHGPWPCFSSAAF